MTRLEELAAEWEPKKEYLAKDLWVIRNFLTEYELEILNREARDSAGWYSTMRSPYGGNIKNKFPETVPEYLEDGTLSLPDKNTKHRNLGIFHGDNGISLRTESVVEKHFSGINAFQSLFEVPEEIIMQECPNAITEDFSMDWHYENGPGKIHSGTDHPQLTAQFMIYINDDFDGGLLMFKNYPDIVIKPEPGMLVNVPMTEEFTHKVTMVKNGNRHSLYGKSWENLDKVHVSSNEDC